MTRSGRLAVGVLVLCAIWAAVLVVPLTAARSDHETSLASNERAQADLTSAAAARDEWQQEILTLEARVDRQTATLAALGDGAGRVAEQSSVARTELGAAQASVDELSTGLAQTQGLADRQFLAAWNLDTCIGGTTDAIALLYAGKRPEGIQRLQGVTDACRAAETYIAEGKGDFGFPWDFADPFVLPDGDAYLAYATNAVGGHVQVIQSSDLHTWNWVGEALPVLPDWADPYLTWAPSVVHLGDHYALYFSAKVRGSSMKCIGVAFSPSAVGPFGGSPPEPLVCQADELGSIDPSPFINTDGKPYLVWKSDGDADNRPAKLWSAPLSDDGGRLTWFPTELLASDQPNEDHTIEGPDMVHIDGQWYLFYSANRWDSPDYRVDVARCDSASGPCTKAPNNTVLASYENVKGPGGSQVFAARDGTLRVAYHGWREPDVGFPNNRYLHVDQLSLDLAGLPVITR